MFEIIPAIDLIGGQCVRLTRGDYTTRKVYAEDPVAVARQFEAAGLRRLHVVDLEGAKAGRLLQAETLRKLCHETGLAIDFGGGVRSDADIELAFDCGVHQVTAGSIAVHNPERVFRWLEKYGADRIILGADTRDGRIAVSGWQRTADVQLDEFLATYQRHGIRRIICTDTARDGALSGPAVALYAQLAERYPALEVIASGGVHTIDDLTALQQAGARGAIIGKALYERTIRLDELERFLSC